MTESPEPGRDSNQIVIEESAEAEALSRFCFRLWTRYGDSKEGKERAADLAIVFLRKLDKRSK